MLRTRTPSPVCLASRTVGGMAKLNSEYTELKIGDVFVMSEGEYSDYQYHYERVN